MGFLNNDDWNGKLFNGAYVDASGGAQPVMEPAVGEPLMQVGVATAADVADTTAIAAAAQKKWAATSPRDRSAILTKAAAIFQQNFDELALYIARETGGLIPKGQHEVKEASLICTIAAGMPLQEQGIVLPSTPGRTSIARRIPHGVVGVISPFNFPLILSIRAVAPALAVGNAVIVKPDPRTPVTGGFMIAKVFAEAGLPAGLLCVLPGGVAAGEALVVDPLVPMIQFTGSVRAGRRVGALAGEHLKKVSLELGGNSSLIILDDADLDLAAKNAAWGAYFHQGQICMATNRILVHESLAEGLKAQLVGRAMHYPVGNGATEEVVLGPMIDENQAKRIESIVNDSVAAGAVLEAGGVREGRFYKPTVLSNVQPGMRIFDEEPFGPVANLITFSTDQEAIELANNQQGSLAAGIISNSIGRAMAIGAQLKSGMIHINDQTINDECVNPFGGPGVAGNGGSVGPAADWENYTQWQWITIKDTPTPYPF